MLTLYKRCSSIRTMQLSIRRLHDDMQPRESALRKQIKDEIERDKEALKWRKPHNEASNFDTKLRYFANDEQNSDFMVIMQKPIELNPKEWLVKWEKKKERKERIMQQFIPQRHEILGADLATAHFILYRKGAVKFLHSKNWMVADENDDFNLPNTYQPQYKIEAIKCDNMNLYYEGLENIQHLQELKFLSFRNVKSFDDWCLDRISGSNCPKLEILDISGTKCTARGLSCLYRLNNLKLLLVDDPKSTLEYELTCSMLEEALPNLKIAKADAVHE